MQPTLPDRVGGRPALDFVNTVDPRHRADRREYLTDYATLLVWADQMADQMADHPEPADRETARPPGDRVGRPAGERTGPSGVRLPAPVGALGRLADTEPAAARAVLDRALVLRESLYAVFAAALTGRQVADADLAVVNDQLCRATDHHLLRPAPAGGVRDGWVGAESLD